jgi:hypothetical protein
MFTCDILAETPPPTMKSTRQACNPSLDVKGAGRRLPGDNNKQQYLCQIIKKIQIMHKTK